MPAVIELENAAGFLEHDGVLDQLQPVQREALLFKLLKLVQVRLVDVLDMFATGLEELWKDDRAADRAAVRDRAIRLAVAAALVAARLLNLSQVALVGVLVAEEALWTASPSAQQRKKKASSCGCTHARARRIQRLETAVVEHPHLLHAAHAGLAEHVAALVPLRPEAPTVNEGKMERAASAELGTHEWLEGGAAFR